MYKQIFQINYLSEAEGAWRASELATRQSGFSRRSDSRWVHVGLMTWDKTQVKRSHCVTTLLQECFHRGLLTS